MASTGKSPALDSLNRWEAVELGAGVARLPRRWGWWGRGGGAWWGWGRGGWGGIRRRRLGWGWSVKRKGVLRPQVFQLALVDRHVAEAHDLLANVVIADIPIPSVEAACGPEVKRVRAVLLPWEGLTCPAPGPAPPHPGCRHPCCCCRGCDSLGCCFPRCH